MPHTPDWGIALHIMKIARNAICPCGSGKKYKRCCGSDAPAILQASKVNPAVQQLSQAIEESGATSLDEMQAIADQIFTKSNTQPLTDFLGLSPTQMSKMLYQPFKSPEIVQFNQEWFPENAVALKIFNDMAESIGNEGVKATKLGNLPLKLCQNILHNLPEEALPFRFGIRSEVDFEELHCIRISSESAGLIKKQKNRYFLTPLGSELIQTDNQAGIFHALFKAYTNEFNWAFRDRYPEIDIIQTGWLFSLYCLSIFGTQWRNTEFYAQQFLQAFPMALEELEENQYMSIKREFTQCYNLRTMKRFAQFFGLIEVRTPERGNEFLDYEIQAINLCDWLQFHV